MTTPPCLIPIQDTGIVLGDVGDLFSQIAWPKRGICEILVEIIEGEHRCLRFVVSMRS